MPALGIKQHFLLERETNSHRHAAFDLALHQHGINRRAAIVRGDHTYHFHLAGFIVDVHFGDLSGIDVGAKWLALAGFRVQRQGFGIKRGATYRRLSRDHPRVVGHITDVHIALWEAFDENFVVLCFELRRLDAEQWSGYFEKSQFGLFGCHSRGIAGHISRAAGNGAGVHRRGVGVGGNDVHVIGCDSQLLCGDLRQNRQRALACFHRAGEQSGRAVLVDLHHGRARVRCHSKSDRIPHAGHTASAPFHD